MRRRRFLELLAGGAALGTFGPVARRAVGATATRRVLPSDARWPDEATWKTRGQQLRGTLTRVES
ncbi:MAG TPA: hypothetical protein VGK85_06885, partial [Myxococcaceae bacterium]